MNALSPNPCVINPCGALTPAMLYDAITAIETQTVTAPPPPEFVSQIQRDFARAAALAHVNDLLHAMGGTRVPAMLPGKRGVPGECAIAQTIMHGLPGAEVRAISGQTEVQINGTRYSRSWGRGVQTFVSEFDNAHYHDLMA